MLHVFKNSWALLLGMMLLMLGNGLQGSLLSVRGGEAGFSAFEMSMVMSAYFLGFLFSSRMTPELIRRVGHVRVFAALGSFISAVLIMYPTFEHPLVWTLGRVVIGFCYCGVYVTAESWLNNAATNETRGQSLSLYMIVQMVGIIASQALLLVPDSSGYLLYVIPSVLVSIAFAPILLSITPTPAFETTKPMSLSDLYRVSPLGCVGMFLLGGVFSAQFGMAAVYGTQAGMTLQQISMFVASFYVGALLLQYPLGYMSDRMDRRQLITGCAAIGGGAAAVAVMLNGNFTMLLVAAFLIGGMSNPLYSLLIAYTNDFLGVEDMAASSGGLLFINGLGAIAGPLITGWLIEVVGPGGYFVFIGALMLSLAVYALYRMTQRAAPSVEDTAAYSPLAAGSSPVAVEVAQELAIESSQEDSQDAAA
ncbi:MFS transporter [Primorskyibacter sedentarius]|uniref:MFS transporter n=1 Tax=Primorskyibacter sedentarius TaxID=745311 RepID=A0A4R3J8K0_9RHOB|nr:MFS transporter [Primorskyibacter sedentarius]TCS62269.1 MFS transporter [Primorskyibacter sedentarius]